MISDARRQCVEFNAIFFVLDTRITIGFCLQIVELRRERPTEKISKHDDHADTELVVAYSRRRLLHDWSGMRHSLVFA